jgi:hypothetical protein
MKCAGKTLAIGRSGTEVRSDRDILPYDVISRKMSVPNTECIFLICHALRTGPKLRQERNLCRATRATKFPAPSRLHFIPARQAGRHILLPTGFEFISIADSTKMSSRQG